MMLSRIYLAFEGKTSLFKHLSCFTFWNSSPVIFGYRRGVGGPITSEYTFTLILIVIK